MTLSDIYEQMGQVIQGTLSHAKRFEFFNKRNGKPLTVLKKGRNISSVFQKSPWLLYENRLENAGMDVEKLVRRLCDSQGKRLVSGSRALAVEMQSN